jgi:hypothetical protein
MTLPDLIAALTALRDELADKWPERGTFTTRGAAG